MIVSANESANEYLEQLLLGNRAKCSAIAKEYLVTNPSVLNLYENVLKVALYEVGELWEANKISVATEHVATAITEGILNELFEQVISAKRYNKKVVVACVENEQHQVGIKMVADVFEMNGWESFFLGNSIPTNELIRYIGEVKPDILAISLSVYFNWKNLLTMLEKIQLEFPNLEVIIGGQAISDLSNESMSALKGVLLINDLYMLEKYIQILNKEAQ